MGEDRPVERLLPGAAPGRARLVGQGNDLLGIGHRHATVVGPALGGATVLELDQALGEVS